MKIENNKLIFEEIQCWDCNGKKEVTRYDSCPLYGKPVKLFSGHKCPHCGAKNKHSHNTVGHHQESCHTCEGKGTRMENEYDTITPENWEVLVKSFRFTVSRIRRNATFQEEYIGGGKQMLGMIDYGRTTSLSDTEVLEKVPTESTPGQPVQWLNKDGTIPVDLIIYLRPDGYSVYPKA